MSIASKLKDLVIKWGGQPTKDDDSIEELIALLTELDAPSSGSGGGVLVVNVTSSDDGQTITTTCDKTTAEILDARPNVVFCSKSVNDKVGSETTESYGGISQVIYGQDSEGSFYTFIADDLALSSSDLNEYPHSRRGK